MQTASGTLYIASGDVQATILALREMGFCLPIRYAGDYGIVNFQPTPLTLAARIDFQGFPGVLRTELIIHRSQDR
jgi:hypothetical protein